MIFKLRNGARTEVVFWRGKDGKSNAFPRENVKLILEGGTKEAKRMLFKILKGFSGLDRESFRKLAISVGLLGLI